MFFSTHGIALQIGIGGVATEKGGCDNGQCTAYGECVNVAVGSVAGGVPGIAGGTNCNENVVFDDGCDGNDIVGADFDGDDVNIHQVWKLFMLWMLFSRKKIHR